MEYLIGMLITIGAFSLMVFMLSRKKGNDNAAFLAHWEKAHAIQQLKLAELKRIADALEAQGVEKNGK